MPLSTCLHEWIAQLRAQITPLIYGTKLARDSVDMPFERHVFREVPQLLWFGAVDWLVQAET